MKDLSNLLLLARAAASEASAAVLDVYNSGDFQTERKDDLSPLTLADKRAHEAIVRVLHSSTLPILSEEGRDVDYAVRKDWKSFWLVDPLDGTKEFIRRNGEFTVNIALIEGQQPVLGVVVVPVTGEEFFAAKGLGAHLTVRDKVSRLAVRIPVDLGKKGLRVVASRSHLNAETQQFIDQLNAPELVSSGSSLKFMLVASGKADAYPRFAPTMEWDTAAAHAIINEVGLEVYQKDAAAPLVYNKESLVNPSFVCR